MKMSRSFFTLFQHLCVISLLLNFCALSLPVRAGAESTGLLPEEEELMRLYFSEDDLVESSSRYPKSILEVAENVTIVTSKEIEAMRVHTLDEVLARVAGVFEWYIGHDFGTTSYTLIQGSRVEHTLALIDGVRLNTASGGDALLSYLPLQIVERLEVIKGPASAAWGSSLGGVINIITKNTGKSEKPVATVAASYGEAVSREFNADLSGKLNRFGYYLYAGRKDSDGLRNSRFVEDPRFYAKLSLVLPKDAVLTASFGHTDPYYKVGVFPGLETHESQRDRLNFASANLALDLRPDLKLNLGARSLTRAFTDDRRFLRDSALAQWITAPVQPDDLLYRSIWDENSKGANFHLTWQPEARQTIAFGGEISRGKVEKRTVYGAAAQDPTTGWAAPAQDVTTPGFEEFWGFYLNDTVKFGKLSIIPGLRYDQHSISDELVSPSLGLVYRLRPDTLLRATASQGFLKPILSYLKINDTWGGQLGNPDLKPERVNSLQAGIETTSLDYVRLKLSLFNNEVTDSWVYNGVWINQEDVRRQGYEVEVETVAVHHFSLLGNFSYVLSDSPQVHDDELYAANLTLNYEIPAFRAALYGHYIWWDLSNTNEKPHYGNFTWDLSAGKTILVAERLPLDLYAVVHNLFNTGQYWDCDYQNSDRWTELGVKIMF